MVIGSASRKARACGQLTSERSRSAPTPALLVLVLLAMDLQLIGLKIAL
jgi:hypothetical protein